MKSNSLGATILGLSRLSHKKVQKFYKKQGEPADLQNKKRNDLHPLHAMFYRDREVSDN
jgi:peroxiredoxin